MEPFRTEITTAAVRRLSVTEPGAAGTDSDTLLVDAYATYREQIYGFLVSLTRDHHAAEDILQETFARLTREVHAGRVPENQRAWLYQVARNLVVSRSRRRRVAEHWQSRQTELGTASSAESHYLLHEASGEVAAAMAELSPTDRTALLMAADGYSGAEIAARLGHTSAAVRTRICRARSRLRSLLAENATARSRTLAA